MVDLAVAEADAGRVAAHPETLIERNSETLIERNSETAAVENF